MTSLNQASQETLRPLRSVARLRRRIDVEIESELGRRFPAIVHDISQHGMGAVTSGTHKPFDMIVVIKPGYGRVRGEIRWVEGNKIGVLFAEPIDIDFFNLNDG